MRREGTCIDQSKRRAGRGKVIDGVHAACYEHRRMAGVNVGEGASLGVQGPVNGGGISRAIRRGVDIAIDGGHQRCGVELRQSSGGVDACLHCGRDQPGGDAFAGRVAEQQRP